MPKLVPKVPRLPITTADQFASAFAGILELAMDKLKPIVEAEVSLEVSRYLHQHVQTELARFITEGAIARVAAEAEQTIVAHLEQVVKGAPL